MRIMKQKKMIYLKPRIQIESKDHCLRKWESKRFKWFIVIQDESNTFDDYQRINNEDFDKVKNKKNIIVKVITDTHLYIIKE